MKKICLIGPVDKRIIAYPLIKCLIHLGRTLIVTDDGVYRRFDDEYSTNFTYSQSEFLIVPMVNEDLENEINEKNVGFDYVLYITTNELPESDVIIYCHGVEKSFCSKPVLDVLEDKECGEVYITFSRVEIPKGSNTIRIEPIRDLMAYVFECEEKKEFLPTKSSMLLSLLVKFFEKELDVPKSTLKGLLLRKG